MGDCIDTRSGADLDRLAGLFGVRRECAGLMVETDESLRARTVAEFKRIQGRATAMVGPDRAIPGQDETVEEWRCGCWRRTKGENVQTFECGYSTRDCYGLKREALGKAQAALNKYAASAVGPERRPEAMGASCGAVKLANFDAEVRAHLAPLLPGRLRIVTDLIGAYPKHPEGKHVFDRPTLACFVTEVTPDGERDVYHFCRGLDDPEPYGPTAAACDAANIGARLLKREARR